MLLAGRTGILVGARSSTTTLRKTPRTSSEPCTQTLTLCSCTLNHCSLESLLQKSPNRRETKM
ncbi:unnamed protein product [Rangifer tarandus platyrhynchus]|uniref:Uncharacterized protein n=1 Tax=Rangifer tarandus platyrhynchus TaxID=3082113 RepID=A0ABN8XZG4_RANTA|nr:unnamed protein product [Rangifer tarandus platyrhynchus]